MVSGGGAGDPMNGGSGVVSLLCPEHPTGLQPCGLDSWQFRRLVPRDDLGLERRHGQSHTTTGRTSTCQEQSGMTVGLSFT